MIIKTVALYNIYVYICINLDNKQLDSELKTALIFYLYSSPHALCHKCVEMFIKCFISLFPHFKNASYQYSPRF